MSIFEVALISFVIGWGLVCIGGVLLIHWFENHGK